MYWPVLNFGSSLFCITEYELFIKIFPTTTWALVDLLLPPAASSSTIAGLRFYVTPKICQTVKNNWCTSFSLFIYSLFTFHFSLFTPLPPASSTPSFHSPHTFQKYSSRGSLSYSRSKNAFLQFADWSCRRAGRPTLPFLWCLVVR
jgi:hypothetical protein